jgi:hypothetical protein
MCNVGRVVKAVGQLNPYPLANANGIYFSVSKGYKFPNYAQREKMRHNYTDHILKNGRQKI